MGDQGAGGGIESHMPTHRRQDSTTEEAIPTEPAPETRNPPAESEQPDQFSQTIQELPRGVTPTVEGQSAPGLSRNPSTCSTSSNSRQMNPEYLTTQTSHQRPSPSRNVSATPRPLEPPVTKITLSELDVSKIIHNPKLRHDINFDPELHFRPNLDGEKGRRKQEKAQQFWDTLTEQLVQFVLDREGFLARYGASDDWCLPSLLKAVKDIIETLVPQRDRELLNEGLNVELLMQQFNRGVADLEKLAAWLSGVLKLHCAPMRDEWVDEMYSELSNGNRNNDVHELVKGMRSLLSVLEAMKLDVANHQIRCLRPVLIEDTVHFEQRFFLRKIQAGKLNIEGAKRWYRQAEAFAAVAYRNLPATNQHAFGETAVFFEALTRLILPSTSTEHVPNTFLFDEERIIKLRSDLYDSICLEICMRRYEELEPLSRATQLLSVPAYLGAGSARSSRSSFEGSNTPSSRPSSLAFSDRGSNTSSPRNSACFFSQPTVDFEDPRSKAQDLYSTLLALLQTSTPASRPEQRWKALAGDMALQILRFVDAPPALTGLEQQLAALLSCPNCDVFQEVEAQFQQRLLAELGKRVKEFRNLSGVGLFSIATGGRINSAHRWEKDQRDVIRLDGTRQERDPRDEAGIEDMAIRLAHFGMLHWRVWSPMAYVVAPEL